MAKSKKTEAPVVEETATETPAKEVVKDAAYLEGKVTPVHEGHAAYIKETFGVDVNPAHIFAVYSTRVAYRKTSEQYGSAKEQREAAKIAAEEAKAEAAKEREAAREAKKEAKEKAKAEKAAAAKAEKEAAAKAEAEKPAEEKTTAKKTAAKKTAAPKGTGKTAAAKGGKKPF